MDLPVSNNHAEYRLPGIVVHGFTVEQLVELVRSGTRTCTHKCAGNVGFRGNNGRGNATHSVRAFNLGPIDGYPPFVRAGRPHSLRTSSISARKLVT
jgi:hypothetical protein